MQPETKPALQLTLVTGQILAVTLQLHTITDRKLLLDIAAAQAEGTQRAEIENRTYHIGTKSTPGLGYDDRLTMRLKCCAATAYIYLALTAQSGGLRHTRLGKKYYITERAVHDWEGDSKA
jgi:hypothetical protein